MGLAHAIELLVRELRSLREELGELALHAATDRPRLPGPSRARGVPGAGDAEAEAPHYLVGELSDAVTECGGRVAESAAAADDARRAGEPPVRWHDAVRSLSECRAHAAAARARFTREIGGRGADDRLAEAGARHGGEWAAWVSCIRDRTAVCRRRFGGVERAVADALETLAAELAVREGPLSVMVIEGEPRRSRPAPQGGLVFPEVQARPGPTAAARAE